MCETRAERLCTMFKSVLTRCTFTPVHPNPCSSPHILAICLLVCTSLPAWRSAAVKVRDLTNCVYVLVHSKLIFYLFMLILLLSSFSSTEHFICQSCMSNSILPLPLLLFPLHICCPTPLFQGDPASQSPLSVRLGPY